MLGPEIEEFAERLARSVRDAAIRAGDINRSPAAKGVIAKRWRAAGVKNVEQVIPDCVDDALFFLLLAIDQGVLRLSYTASNGRTVDLTEEGEAELAGWFAGTDETTWRAKYSEERFIDDFADMD